jgi:hypothetical protein
MTDWSQPLGQVRYRRVPSAEPKPLADAVRSEGASMLIASEGDAIPNPEAISALLAELDCPLILMR